jgi:hypothetical protein
MLVCDRFTGMSRSSEKDDFRKNNSFKKMVEFVAKKN